MRYLAISKTPYYVAYALFHGKGLSQWGKVKLTEPNESKRLLEWEQIIVDMVEDFEPTFLLTHLLDLNKTLKKDLERVVEIRTILKLVAEKHNVMYCEFKTSGWEKKITKMKPTAREKLRLLNEGYGLGDLKDIEIADAIILAEGVAHDRLQIAR